MELKQLIANFSYRIEPKPEGGFIARGSDPSLPVLEAATREELQEKMQARANEAIAAAFPGLNLAAAMKDSKFAFQMEPKPGGGYIAHSIGPDGKPIEGSAQQSAGQRVAEKAASMLGEYLLPNLPKAFGNLNTKDVKVLFDVKTVGPRLRTTVVEKSGLFSKLGGGNSAASGQNTGILNNANDNSPIQPEASSSWPLIRFLLRALAFATLLYFLFFHRLAFR